MEKRKSKERKIRNKTERQRERKDNGREKETYRFNKKKGEKIEEKGMIKKEMKKERKRRNGTKLVRCRGTMTGMKEIDRRMKK
jgi:hypothetical protein